MKHSLITLIALVSCPGLRGVPVSAQERAPALQRPNNRPQDKPSRKISKAAQNRLFLSVRHRSFYLGEVPFYNVGVNIPDLFERFLRNEDATALEALDNAKVAGVTVVRFWGIARTPETMGLFFADRPRWMAAFDRMMTALKAREMRAVPSLLGTPDLIPMYIRSTTESQSEQIKDLLTPQSRSNQLAVEYITAMVTAYRDDPFVLFWEIGSKYNQYADVSRQEQNAPANQITTSDQIRTFLQQMARVIKEHDKRHMVTSGNTNPRPNAWHRRQARLQQPNVSDPLNFPPDLTLDTFRQYTEMLQFLHPDPIDIISVHLAPTGEQDTPLWLEAIPGYAFTLPWARTAADLAGKPLFVGEFASPVTGRNPEPPPSAESQERERNPVEPGAEWTRDFLRRVRRDHIAPISALWTWEYAPDSSVPPAYVVSPEQTPALVRLLASVNASLLRQSLAILGAELEGGRLEPREPLEERVRPPR